MGNTAHIVVAIIMGLNIVMAINKFRNRKTPSPISLEAALAQQTKVINDFMSFDPGLKDIFREAIRDGATHKQHAPQDDTFIFSPADTIAFHRIRDGNYEKRFLFLHEKADSQGAKWELNWRK